MSATTIKPIDECKTVAELLADKSRWTQKTCARDTTGRRCDTISEHAASFCILGACARVYSEAKHYGPYEKFRSVVGTFPSQFNDTHTYEEVYAKVLEAGI